jgi:hypothetical protein
MESRHPNIQRYIEAWKKGDDATTNQITIKVIQGGDDSELIDLSRAVDGLPYGPGK